MAQKLYWFHQAPLLAEQATGLHWAGNVKTNACGVTSTGGLMVPS